MGGTFETGPQLFLHREDRYKLIIPRQSPGIILSPQGTLYTPNLNLNLRPNPDTDPDPYGKPGGIGLPGASLNEPAKSSGSLLEIAEEYARYGCMHGVLYIGLP